MHGEHSALAVASAAIVLSVSSIPGLAQSNAVRWRTTTHNLGVDARSRVERRECLRRAVRGSGRRRGATEPERSFDIPDDGRADARAIADVQAPVPETRRRPASHRDRENAASAHRRSSRAHRDQAGRRQPAGRDGQHQSARRFHGAAGARARARHRAARRDRSRSQGLCGATAASAAASMGPSRPAARCGLARSSPFRRRR